MTLPVQYERQKSATIKSTDSGTKPARAQISALSFLSYGRWVSHPLLSPPPL